LHKAENAESNNEALVKQVQAEQFKMLYAYIHEYQAAYPDLPDDRFEHYALKMAEMVAMARQCRIPHAGYKQPFTEWLYQTSAGSLDFNREPYKWFNDKKIDQFLADPVKTLKTRVYLQEEIEGGIELPAKAWMGSRYFEKYQGRPAMVIRRKSSSESRVKAYFKLERVPEGNVKLELQGLDNEKKEIAEIAITINGEKIFAGPIDYPKNTWGTKTYEIPSGILKPGENIIAIENTMDDYKDESSGGEAGPAEEALAKNYNWGWCMVSTIKLLGLP